jgi:hypothetical protein
MAGAGFSYQAPFFLHFYTFPNLKASRKRLIAVVFLSFILMM